MNNKILGREGEELAARYLETEGYEIIETNFNCGFGEIDIIAKKENELAFVEVKTRTQTFFGMPVDSVNVPKQRHIYKTAEYYIYKTNAYNYEVSFDVIEVYVNQNNQKYSLAEIKHLKHTFSFNTAFSQRKEY